MSEAETKSAELVDIEPDDFARFLEYAYRGDYTVPSWTLDEGKHVPSDVAELPVVNEDLSIPEPEPWPVAEEPPPPAEPDEYIEEDLTIPEPEAPWELAVEAPAPEPMPALETVDEGEPSIWGRLISKNKGKKKRSSIPLRLSSQERSYLTEPMPYATITEGFQPKANAAANQNFAPVFLAHARLYTFAEMRLIYPLKGLALHKLHKTLLQFQLYHQRVGDVVELAHYAYENGPSRSDSGVLDDLRQLVVEYMACEVDIIGKHLDFQILLEGGGEFVSDFWGIVSKHLL
ncbi:hypothetical protein BKA63DRAFT_531863 [Paraphoma chrysanthemicola]|nr:hypothetical protein BKA63DRAFT_531863 [Paraphoma chrysanthemicola]